MLGCAGPACDLGGQVEGAGSSESGVGSQGALPSPAAGEGGREGVNKKPKRAFDTQKTLQTHCQLVVVFTLVFQAVGIRYPELSVPAVRAA